MKFFILFIALVSTITVFGQQKMSERELDGFKGKVKSVTTVRQVIESKNYRDNTLKTLRDRVEYYDEDGFPTKTIDYEHNYKDVYAIIDGDLTSKYSQLDKTQVRRLTIVGSETETKKEVKPEDECFDIKFKYEFDGKGRIVERKTYGNNGDLYRKIVYKYDKKGVLAEELRYDDGTRLNEQYFYKYDSDGNLIEAKQILHRPNKNNISFLKYSDYKLDSQGNWIERTVTSLKKSRGKELKVVIKNSRNIEYFK